MTGDKLGWQRTSAKSVVYDPTVKGLLDAQDLAEANVPFIISSYVPDQTLLAPPGKLYAGRTFNMRAGWYTLNGSTAVKTSVVSTTVVLTVALDGFLLPDPWEGAPRTGVLGAPNDEIAFFSAGPHLFELYFGVGSGGGNAQVIKAFLAIKYYGQNPPPSS